VPATRTSAAENACSVQGYQERLSERLFHRVYRMNKICKGNIEAPQMHYHAREGQRNNVHEKVKRGKMKV
jgi:hypothetical protein